MQILYVEPRSGSKLFHIGSATLLFQLLYMIQSPFLKTCISGFFVELLLKYSEFSLKLHQTRKRFGKMCLMLTDQKTRLWTHTQDTRGYVSWLQKHASLRQINLINPRFMLSFACFSTIVPNVMVNCFQWRIADRNHRLVSRNTRSRIWFSPTENHTKRSRCSGTHSVVQYTMIHTMYTSTQHSVKIISQIFQFATNLFHTFFHLM